MFKFEESYPACNAWSRCFFDIETTGLSSKHSRLAMASLLIEDETGSLLKQYLVESKEQESFLLIRLQQDLLASQPIITYNGKSFDFPFLKGRASALNLPWTLDHVAHFDLYHLLGRKGTLKEREQEFYERRDSLTGKAWVERYFCYLKNKDEAIRQEISLHNTEDVLGLQALLKGHPAVEKHLSDHIVKDKIILDTVLSPRNLRILFFDGDHVDLPLLKWRNLYFWDAPQGIALSNEELLLAMDQEIKLERVARILREFKE